MKKNYIILMLGAIIVLSGCVGRNTTDLFNYNIQTQKLEKVYYPDENITCYFIQETPVMASIGGMSCFEGRK